jgi:hypothetical protein
MLMVACPLQHLYHWLAQGHQGYGVWSTVDADDLPAVLAYADDLVLVTDSEKDQMDAVHAQALACGTQHQEDGSSGVWPRWHQQ